MPQRLGTAGLEGEAPGGAGSKTPTASAPPSPAHTCLRARTLAASGGEKGDVLCFKSVFASAGRKQSQHLRKAGVKTTSGLGL